MSTPLIALAAILAFFALILIPLMMFTPKVEEKHDVVHDHAPQRKKFKKKKKR